MRGNFLRLVVYYLTGPMASNYWGIPRSTHDLDFVVQLPQAAVLGICDGEFKTWISLGELDGFKPSSFGRKQRQVVAIR